MTSSTASPALRREPGTPETAVDWIAGAGAFAVEIALAVTWGVVGHRAGSRIGGPVVGWLGAVVAVAALVVVWSTWMSPKADHRLELGARLVLGCGLILVAATGAWVTGSTTWALVLAVGGVVITVVAQALMD